MIPNAHACMQSCTTRTRAQNSRYKYKRNAKNWWLAGRWLFSSSIFAFLPRLRIFLSGTHFFQGICKIVFCLLPFPILVISKASEIEENVT